MNNCKLCPRNCGVNRENNELGYCLASSDMKIAKAYLHKWEEPCISGKLGSGTIFFSHCNLRCIFCQNYEISTKHFGKIISIDRFSEICLELQEKGANNINLVTPTHYVPLIIKGIKLAKNKGLTIPIVYNSSAYENVETIESLKDIVDIYLPDLKYYDNDIAIKYSNAFDYFKYATLAIDKMYEQVGKCVFDKDGNLIKGVIVRHLMLPSHLEDSKKIIKYLYDKYQNNIYISIMRQYTPIKKLKYEELNTTVKDYLYDELIDYAYDLGIRCAYIQEEESCSDSFIPKFDNEGL